MDTTTDRFSQLPETIIQQQIWSLLPVKDVARMSTLSKILNSVWKTHPHLNFGDNFLDDNAENRNVVHKALANRKRHKIPIDKFWLGFSYWVCRSTCLQNWIKMLVACNIKELNLWAGKSLYNGEPSYNKLPEEIFDAKLLKLLTLKGFKLELPSNGIIKFWSLRELYFSDVFLDEKFIQAVCTSCSNLEELYLHCFHGLSSFQVGKHHLPKLNRVRLEFCPSEFQKVDIAAVNLEQLRIYNKKSGDQMLVKITACNALKRLALNGVAVTDKWLEQLFSSLQNLESIVLFNSNKLKNMKISSYKLKQLMVYNCPNVVDAQVFTPNLILFSYGCYSLPTLNLKASAFLKAIISFEKLETTASTDWYSKLTDFLGNYNRSIAMELSSKNDEVIVIPKDMRVNLLPPLHSTNNLHVKIENQLTYSVVDVVDSLLWVSPQLDTISFRELGDVKTLKFVHEDASNEDEKPCCTSLPLKCWRHKLKQVNMQKFSCMEQLELRDYFSMNADISVIIDAPQECC